MRRSLTSARSCIGFVVYVVATACGGQSSGHDVSGTGGASGSGGHSVTGGMGGSGGAIPIVCGTVPPPPGYVCVGPGGDGGVGGTGGFITGGFGGVITDGGFAGCDFCPGGTGGVFPESGGFPTGGSTNVPTHYIDAGSGCSFVTYPPEAPSACTAANACVSLRATTPAGGAGDASSPVDAGPAVTALDAPLCDPPSPSATYLFAFDAYSTGPNAGFELTTGRAECAGATLEEFSVGDFPDDVATGWKTYCFSVPGSRLESRVGVVAGQPGAVTVENLRAVTSCDCVRDAHYQTTCGNHGSAGSSGCL